MFGVPGQTMELWQRSVEALVALGPEHVSAYALTVEPGTAYASLSRRGRLERPDDEAAAEMFRWGRQALAGAGYRPYEVSSYARARLPRRPQSALLDPGGLSGRGRLGRLVPPA